MAIAERTVREYAEEILRGALDPDNLTIAENLFISPCYFERKFWTGKEIRKYLEDNKGNKELHRELSTPIGLLENKKTAGEINEGRLRNKRLIGHFPIFEKTQSLQFIELRELDAAGQVSGEWRVGLLGKIPEKVDRSAIKIRPKYRKLFSLGWRYGGRDRILRLKIFSEKSGKVVK